MNKLFFLLVPITQSYLGLFQNSYLFMHPSFLLLLELLTSFLVTSQWFSECGLWTSSISTIWELVRNRKSQASPRPSEWEALRVGLPQPVFQQALRVNPMATRVWEPVLTWDMDPAHPTWTSPPSHQHICCLSPRGIKVGNIHEKCLAYNNNACMPDTVLSGLHFLTDLILRITPWDKHCCPVFHRWGNCGTEQFSNFPKTTQL